MFNFIHYPFSWLMYVFILIFLPKKKSYIDFQLAQIRIIWECIIRFLSNIFFFFCWNKSSTGKKYTNKNKSENELIGRPHTRCGCRTVQNNIGNFFNKKSSSCVVKVIRQRSMRSKCFDYISNPWRYSDFFLIIKIWIHLISFKNAFKHITLLQLSVINCQFNNNWFYLR